MSKKISDVLGISHQDLENEGVFDSFINIDSQLHIDPYLLRTVSIPDFADSRRKFNAYFENIIRLLQASTNKTDRMFTTASKLLQFKELPNVSLGYSKSSSGTGIGPILAKKIASSAKEIIDAGIVDPIIFELVGLFEEKIGSDRISDMTIRIILEDLLSFTQRLAINYQSRVGQFSYKEQIYNLPFNQENGQFIVFVPIEILRKLPVANDWDDIDIVCEHNADIRRRINKMIGRTWKEATSKKRKLKLRETILAYPEVMRDLITKYSVKEASHYDFSNDPDDLFKWEMISQDYANNFPLRIENYDSLTNEKLLEIVLQICGQYKKLIEDNGLNRLLYDGHKLKNERFAQLLFFGIADSYCNSNNLDLSREPNAGRGPVDFKISRGANFKINVELKYSTNNNLLEGYITQLPIYNRSENSLQSILLIIKTSSRETLINDVIATREAEIQAGRRAPQIQIVDGRIMPSASRARSL
jgi:hypothetical protein